MATTISRRSSSGGNSSGSNNGSPQTPIKKPKRRNERNILTFYEKIAVIRYYDETNVSRNSLAKMFHCCATQIRRILERKQELLQQLATLSEADASIIIEEMTRKRRKFEMSAISFILHQWVQRCQQLRLRKTITNETLKETALKMAAILNLPAFRPSYRWLNRFRGKYKYMDEDLGAGMNNENAVMGELSVEDIIIEFKDSLPSFMQKEISAITQTIKLVDDVAALQADKLPQAATIIINDNSMDDFDVSVSASVGDNEMEAEKDNSKTQQHDNEVLPIHKNLPTPTSTPVAATAVNDAIEHNKMATEEKEEDSLSKSPLATEANQQLNNNNNNNNGNSNSNNSNNNNFNVGLQMNAGTTALFDIVFPHLAIVHQFALLNSDAQALELITKLGVHMQTQAAEGAYKQLTLASNSNSSTNTTTNAAAAAAAAATAPKNDNILHNYGSEADANGGDSLYPDIDDIVLLE